MIIDHIKTDLFSLGCFGRSGSRSIADVLTNYYTDKIFSQHNFVSHHYHSMSDVDKFNSFSNRYQSCPKIFIMRNPLERAKSGSSVRLEQAFHGMPALYTIDFDRIDYIIDFNSINDYTAGIKLGDKSEVDSILEFLSMTTEKTVFNMETMVVNWDHNDYDYTQEDDIYLKVLDSKEKLPLDLWELFVNNYTKINIPSSGKILWDM